MMGQDRLLFSGEFGHLPDTESLAPYTPGEDRLALGRYHDRKDSFVPFSDLWNSCKFVPLNISPIQLVFHLIN